MKLMSWIKALAIIYATGVISALVMIPFAYYLAPLWGWFEALPHSVVSTALQFLWLMGVAIVAGWIVDDWLPLTADQEDNQARPWLLQLPDRVRGRQMK